MKIIESPKPFPLRTLMVCFTIWLIATEILVFDQIRFNANADCYSKLRGRFADQRL